MDRKRSQRRSRLRKKLFQKIPLKPQKLSQKPLPKNYQQRNPRNAKQCRSRRNQKNKS